MAKCGACPEEAEADDKNMRCVCGTGTYSSMTVNQTSTNASSAGAGDGNPNNELCRECPKGADCDVPGSELINLNALKGWWRPPYCQNVHFECFYECVNKNDCAGGIAGGQTPGGVGGTDQVGSAK